MNKARAWLYAMSLIIASLVAREDFFALEVASISGHRKRFQAHGFPRLLGHQAQSLTFALGCCIGNGKTGL
jgi:hypothetical protein